MKTIKLITIFAIITTLMATIVTGESIPPKAIKSLQGK
uniref:U12-MYRTX-Mri1b n=1 Tax=Manica rubida TaxID=219785 RepID=A0A6G9KHD7_MANRB|nr:U12-MYRTX-Mri1b precursor [Manica rubida]